MSRAASGASAAWRQRRAPGKPVSQIVTASHWRSLSATLLTVSRTRTHIHSQKVRSAAASPPLPSSGSSGFPCRDDDDDDDYARPCFSSLMRTRLRSLLCQPRCRRGRTSCRLFTFTYADARREHGCNSSQEKRSRRGWREGRKFYNRFCSLLPRKLVWLSHSFISHLEPEDTLTLT